MSTANTTVKIHDAIIRLTYRDGSRHLFEYQLKCDDVEKTLQTLAKREQVVKIELFGNIKNLIRHEEWRSAPVT